MRRIDSDGLALLGIARMVALIVIEGCGQLRKDCFVLLTIWRVPC